MSKTIIVNKDMEKINLFRDNPGDFDTLIQIKKPGASLIVNEIFNTSGKARSNLRVEHLAKNTTSRINIKGVVRANDTAISRSVVNVPKTITGCDTDLQQKFLVLDESGKAEAEPALEVEPSKVSAAHSLSISPINPEKIFYMQTRGFTKQDAKKEIVNNFLKT